MSSPNDLRLRLWLVLGMFLLAGCPRSHRCAELEICDQQDNDCDGLVDEGFVDEQGRYVNLGHCGVCGTSCLDAFPTGARAECQVVDEAPRCVLVECPPGEHLEGEGACVPDALTLCLGCDADEDCDSRTPGARCLDVGDGRRRCGSPCEMGCPEGFECIEDQCFPDAGLCACEGVEADFELPCLVEGEADDVVCSGSRVCGPEGLGECVITATELCNGEDDDCDGMVDEDFVDDEGRYVTRLHCGECGSPCTSPGPNLLAECRTDTGVPRCIIECEGDYVDVDGIRANGCECLRFDGRNAPIVVGGDLDCDGEPDDDDRFIHVTNAGDDQNPGTILEPMRTIGAAARRGRAQDKIVLVARGIYPPFSLVEGVNIFGGYRPDFRDREVELYPVLVEPEASAEGTAALRCEDVREETILDGVTLVGQPARVAGHGSTAVFFRQCTESVLLRDVTVLAARGADGQPGVDASQRLPDGFESLSDLDGRDGRRGNLGDDDGAFCATQPGGNGGRHSCGGQDVSGGDGGESGCPDLGCVQGGVCANAGCTDFTVDGQCDLQAVLAQAVPNPSPGTGRGTNPGAPGLVTYDAPTNRDVCNFCDDNPSLVRVGQDGGDGRPGRSGFGGLGCAAPTLAFDDAGRAVAPGGSDGRAGTDGSGGGGGSAGAGYAVIAGTSGDCDNNAGGSGGGGGSGGCGAPAGTAGGGGGASIGILVLAQGAGPRFENVRVITDSGGRGGDGGAGADGGRGGSGAAGGMATHWCARNGGRGGDGGGGGAGGGGGGGCGGASHAVVVRGEVPDAYQELLSESLEIERAGVAGAGGRGGFSPGVSGAPGRRGAADPILIAQ